MICFFVSLALEDGDGRELKLEVEKLVHIPAVVCHIEVEEEMGLEVLGQRNQTWEFTFHVWKWEEGAVVTMRQPFQ